MYLDWIQIIVAILGIVFLLYVIYLLVQPQAAPEGFTLVETPAQKYTIPELKGVTGRYVRIRPSLDPNADGYLTISQIQVFDINGYNLAIKKHVTATSVGGSPVDKKYGGEVLVGDVYEFVPAVSDSPDCIVDGVLIPRDALNNVFETGVQNACSGSSKNCSNPVATDTEYVEIDLSGNTMITSITYIGRNDSITRTIETIDGDFDYLTQVDRIKGMRLEIYNEQRTLTYSSIFPTTDTVQTIKIPLNLYGVNTDAGSSGSAMSMPMTTVSIPNVASFGDFIKPFKAFTKSPERPADVDKSPTLLAYRPMISAINTIYKGDDIQISLMSGIITINTGLDIDLSNNIFLPLLMDSPINFYYDLYKQSGCNPTCLTSSTGESKCIVPTGCVETCNPVCTGTGAAQTCTVPATCSSTAKTKYCAPTYCNPNGVPPPALSEVIPVNIFGTASRTAIEEMNQSIEYCKLLYLGSPPAVENFVRLNFSYTDMTQIKAYLRSTVGPAGTVSPGNTLPNVPPTFCLPDIVQKFRNGSFVTTFSAGNNAWNATHCTTELTPTILGLIPFVSRNFLVQWITNRTIRYKHFINMLTTNVSNALDDWNEAKKELATAEAAIAYASNPANFTPTEKLLVATSVLFPMIPGVGAMLSSIFNPVSVTLEIIAGKSIIAALKRDKVRNAVNSSKATYDAVVALGASVAGGTPRTVPEVATPLRIPSYISINSKTVIDSIAQQFYELMGGQFNISYFYDILPLGSTMLDIRFELYIHDTFKDVNGPINDLKAQYKRIKSASTVSKDILDQAAADYQANLSHLEETSVRSLSSPFQGAVARLFYTTSGSASAAAGSRSPPINITGIIFDDRAVTSFIPELNGGIPVALGPDPGNINYKPTVMFTKNNLEPLDCKNPDTLRRIFDDYISIVNNKKNKYPLSTATPPLDVTKGTLYINSVIGASQLSPTSCSLTWTEILYNSLTNMPISSSGGSGSGGSSSAITRSGTFVYKGDTASWYSSELILDVKGLTLLPSNTGITALTPPILFTKPLPTRTNLDNLSNICPTTNCEDADVLYSLVDQYNSDPTLPGTILTVTHAFTPNPNQCDVKVSINYDSQIKDILGKDIFDPVTGITKTSYDTVKKGAVTYSSSSGKLIEGSKLMRYTGVQKDITIAMYVAIDPATCGYLLGDASGQNTGTSIQSNTPALFTPMIYTKEIVKRTGDSFGSSINKLQADYSKIAGSTKQTLKSYRIQEYNALNDVYGAQGLAGCTSKKCNDPTITQMIRDYYRTTISNNNGILVKDFTNTAQTDKNTCEAIFTTNSSNTLLAYKFGFSSSSCAIVNAIQLLITGPTDDQILDITKEMNAAVKEPFVSRYLPSRPVQSEALDVRGFGMDTVRNAEKFIKDSQFELPLKQQEPERQRRHAPASYKFLRFTPTATRGSAAAAVNVGKFTFFYEEYPLFLKGSVTNPMGTWEGRITDVTGAGFKPGWSDAHKKPLVFAFRDPIAIDAYSFTTAPPEMGVEGDPVSWKLESSHNGTFWTALDIQTNFQTPVRRFTDLEKIYLTIK